MMSMIFGRDEERGECNCKFAMQEFIYYYVNNCSVYTRLMARLVCNSIQGVAGVHPCDRQQTCRTSPMHLRFYVLGLN